MPLLARTLLLSLAAFAAPAAGASAAPPTIEYLPSGDSALIMPMPSQSWEIEQAVVDTIVYDVDARGLDRTKCPTGRVVVSAEKKAKMDAKWQASSKEPKKLAGLFLPSRTGDCRIWLNARVLHRADEAQVCNLMTHELGHARGLAHTDPFPFMQPKIHVLPVDECDWAWSDWLDTE